MPKGATAIGNPARIIEPQSKSVAPHESAHTTSSDSALAPASQPVSLDLTDKSSVQNAQDPSAFSAYGITQADDPVAQSIKELQDRATAQDQCIEALQAELAALTLKLKGK